MCETPAMKFDPVADIVDGIPHMSRRNGRRVYDHVIQNELHRVLELGTHHGVSTCYLGAAVDELGGGSVVTMDRLIAKNLEPNVEELLARTGLSHVVTAIYAERSFTWNLREMLAQPEPPQFDFVFLDGGHTWDVTGFSFFLVDRLLAPGGWLLFDDIQWSLAKSPSVRDKPETKALPEEERNAEQVGDVFRILVERDPNYVTRLDGNWGWAQKRSADDRPGSNTAPATLTSRATSTSRSLSMSVKRAWRSRPSSRS